MAFALRDRVKETSTVTGAGAATLLGATTGFDAFSVIGDGNNTYYVIAHQTLDEWEVGIGTYTLAGTSLARDTVLSSSNGDAAVSFSAGTKDVFVSQPAGRAVFEDDDTDVAIAGALAVTGAATFGTYTGQSSIVTLGTITTGVWTGTDIAVADGGTGSSTAGGARTNLGLVIGTDVQAFGAVLDDFNTLGAASADGEIIVATGAGAFAYESGATARTSLGVAIGTDVQAFGAVLDDFNTLGAAASDGEFIVATGAGVFAYESGATARTSLGLTIGTDVQAFGAVLDDLNTLGAAASDGQFIVATGAGVFAYESGATARTSLGLAIGTDVQAFGDVLDDLNTLGAASADGEFIVATGAGVFAYESGATARTSLGLTIGTDVQAFDAGLTDIAGLAVTDGNIIVGNGSNWVAESGATARTSLGLGTADSPTFTGLTLAGDITNHEAVNDANPEIRLGSADAEELHIQAVYTGAAQTLVRVDFITDTALAGANAGLYRFNVDGADILDIDDGGIDLDTGGALSINGTDVLDATTLGSGVTTSSLTSVGTITTGVWTGTDVAVADGGTGSSTAGGARTNLGLVIGTDVQAFGAVLDDLNTLGAAASDGEFIVATGAGAFAYESGATARTSLGLAIGTDVQAFGAVLDDLNTLGAASADGEFIVATAAGVFAYESGSTVAQSIGGVTQDLDTLGTASADGEFIVATAAGAFAYESGATARTSLGLAIGTDVQAFGAVLDDLNTLGAAASDGEFIVATGAGVFAYESGATARTSLGLVIGTDVQAFGAVLDDFNTLGAASADGEIIVATGAGVFAYESGATARTSLGLGTGDTPEFTGLGLGTSSPEAILDVVGGDTTTQGIRMGNNLTDATTKVGQMTVHHFTNAEEPVTIFAAQSQTAASTVFFGGGSPFLNASTQINFYTAANTTTTTGTIRLQITSAGLVAVGSHTAVRHLDVQDSTALTNTVSFAARLGHITSGTPAIGIGVGQEFVVETSAGNNEILVTIEALARVVTSTAEEGVLIVRTMTAGAAATEKMRVDATGVKLGGGAVRGTTEPTNAITLFNGTAAVGTLTNGASFYVTAGEMQVMDAAGNESLLSPHDPVTGEWIFYSKNTATGRVVRVRMEELMRRIAKVFGPDLFEEFTEDV